MHRDVERIGVKRHTLTAGFVGAAANVLLWVTAPVLEGAWPLTTFCSITDDLNNGTSFKMLKAGRWDISCNISFTVADTTCLAAITRDAVDLVNDPLASQESTRDIRRIRLTAAAGVNAGIGLHASVYITDNMAADPALGIIRIIATNGANGAPTSLLFPEVAIWITWLGDLRGR